MKALLLRSEISLFWRTSCARDFFFGNYIVNYQVWSPTNSHVFDKTVSAAPKNWNLVCNVSKTHYWTEIYERTLNSETFLLNNVLHYWIKMMVHYTVIHSECNDLLSANLDYQAISSKYFVCLHFWLYSIIMECLLLIRSWRQHDSDNWAIMVKKVNEHK